MPICYVELQGKSWPDDGLWYRPKYRIISVGNKYRADFL